MPSGDKFRMPSGDKWNDFRMVSNTTMGGSTEYGNDESDSGDESWADLNQLSQSSLNDMMPSTRSSTKESARCGLATIFDASPSAERAVAHGAEIDAFARAGPLYCKLNQPPSASEWASRAKFLVVELTGDKSSSQYAPSALEYKVAVRIYQLYLPMYFWMKERVEEEVAKRQARGDTERRAVSIGLSAPQGCGKTTAVEILTDLFAADGLHCAAVSIDDFYLTGADQVTVAATHADNDILQVRGNAGTHDIALGQDILNALCSSGKGDVAVPVYDKAARGGKGDRRPVTGWRSVRSPCDVVLLEGWMAGFKTRGPSEADALKAIHPALPEVDSMLADYSALNEMLDAWCVIGLDDFSRVFEWRLEAEQKMAAAGRPGMSDAGVRDFVKRFMPAYKAYCPALYSAAEGPGVDGKPTLLVRVDASRSPVGQARLASKSTGSRMSSKTTAGSRRSSKTTAGSRSGFAPASNLSFRQTSSKDALSLWLTAPSAEKASASATSQKPAAPRNAIMEFVQAGPLYSKMQQPPEVSEWTAHARTLVAELTDDKAGKHFAPSALDSKVAVRIYHLYLPMYFWMKERVHGIVAERKAKGDNAHRAVSIGLSAPQGCGKTTAVEILTKLFADDGLNCAHVSIDDFYLKGADQVAVAAAHADNAILQVRGNAGTHDVSLGEAVLRSLSSATAGDIAVPVYDKAARGGKGDRRPVTEWRSVRSPCDVVLLEGWMAGFKSRGDQSGLEGIHASLPEVDAMLGAYSAWEDLLDAWCVIGLDDLSRVFEWRLEAEQKMAAAGRPGMSDDAVRDFVQRFMPAYTAYCPALYEAAEGAGVDSKPTLLVRVDGTRSPVQPALPSSTDSDAEQSSGASETDRWFAVNDGSCSSSIAAANGLSLASCSTHASSSSRDYPSSLQPSSLRCHLKSVPSACSIFDRVPSTPIERETDEAAEILNFVRAGPLYSKMQLPPHISEWAVHARTLVAELTDDKTGACIAPSKLDSKDAVRIYQLYLPMFFWMRERVQTIVAERKARGDTARRAVSIGLSAPQGCGKTTAVEILTKLFADDGLHCAHVSYDDFYLTGADQDAVAAAHADNAILQVRGNAGTHDISLGTDVVRSMCCSTRGEVSLPVYDKAARSGRGDRRPTTGWRSVHTPCDVVLLEGWMAGFEARGTNDAEALTAIHPSLPEIDALLSGYNVWHDQLDVWCVIGLDDLSRVFDWRLEAERKMAAAGRPGMSDDGVRDFVKRFMPAYSAYCPALYAAAEGAGVGGKPTLLVRVDGSRSPVVEKRHDAASVAEEVFEGGGSSH